MEDNTVSMDEYVRAVHMFLELSDSECGPVVRKKGEREGWFTVGDDPYAWFTLPIRYWDKFDFCCDE